MSALAGGFRRRRDSRGGNRRRWQRGSGRSRARGLAEIGDLAQQLASMTKRHPNFFQILVCEIGQNLKSDIILDKTLSILPETELLKPIRNLLHRQPPYGFDANPFWTGRTVYHTRQRL